MTVMYAVKIVANFYKVQYKHTERGALGYAHCVCFKFPGIYASAKNWCKIG